MNATENELRTTDSRRLRVMANELKADAKAIFPHDKEEALKLFRLFVRIATELHRRRNPALAHLYN